MADTHEAWVERVLGLRMGGTSETSEASPSDLSKAVAGWEDALSKSDTQIGALQQVLRGSPDKDLQDIAEFGLNAITGNHRVKITAALTDLKRGAPSAGTALKLVTSLLDYINTNERVAAIDANPFGVRMNLAGTLAPALVPLVIDSDDSP
jgi:hypothetical protein